MQKRQKKRPKRRKKRALKLPNGDGETNLLTKMISTVKCEIIVIYKMI